MTVLFDTNVLIDVLTVREPFAAYSAAAWALVEAKLCRAFVSAVAITTVHYLVRRHSGVDTARLSVERILQLFQIAPVNAVVIQSAYAGGMTDFEDSVQAFSGLAKGASHIVTKDLNGFDGGPLSSLRPDEFVQLIAGKLP